MARVSTISRKRTRILAVLFEPGENMSVRGSIQIALAAAALVAGPPAWAAASCNALQGCAAKACRLDAEIDMAKAKGDATRLASLERDRGQMARCTDEGLKQKRKVALDQAQKKIDKRESELEKAQASGDASKIKKAQRNLDSARKAYMQIENSPL